MINLLPPKAKKSILIEYWVRVVSVWMILGSIVFLLGAGLLFPVYVLVGSQVAAKESAVSVASQKVDNFENVSASLDEASQLAKYSLRESSLSTISEYVDRIESLEGEYVDINSIQISRVDKEISPILIIGVADDRRELAEFRDRLLAEEDVLEVDLPISNLANDKNIKFTITVTLDNELAI